MFSFKDIPAASVLFSAYASFSATMMLVRSIVNEFIPHELQSYLYSSVRHLFTPLSSDLTLIIDEFSGLSRNMVFDAAELYLRTKVSPDAARLHVSKNPRQKTLAVAIDRGEEIVDEFDNIKLNWTFICTEPDKNSRSGEERYFALSFHKKFKERVLGFYLPFVLIRANAIKEEQKVVKIYSRECPYDDEEGGSRGGWGSVNLEHPSTFETLALDLEMKKTILEDLDRFVRRREFYKKVGKAWKRGYLLYGPPGTGKSSLIAAMANYLKFDIYDLDLTSVYSNSDLRRVLLSTTNRSILVIEDIDCSVDLQNRQYDDIFEASNTRMTLSGLLNFIDGLWSSCGDERILVFTTNHKDRLDPALLRPGRMDMHINLSYCTPNGFKTLASNYLGVHGDHRLCDEIEGLISGTQVTPAEIAEELMKSDNKDVALEGLVNFLKRKTVEVKETQGKASAEAAVIIDGVVNFLRQKKTESVKNKDKETLNAIVALEDIVDLVKRKRIEADGVLRKDKEESDDQNDGPESKRIKGTRNDNGARKSSTVKKSRRVVRRRSKRATANGFIH